MTTKPIDLAALDKLHARIAELEAGVRNLRDGIARHCSDDKGPGLPLVEAYAATKGLLEKKP